MTIDVVAFIIGGILIGTAIVGGGFEIKEIKMPRVGAGVRIVSLVVGSGFLLLGMGIWGANNPQFFAEEHLTNNLVPADTTAVAPERGAETRNAQPDPVESREVVYSEAQPAPQVAAAPQFTGFDGDSQLFWKIKDVEVSANARFTGMSGSIRIGWVDPNTGYTHDVLQDLVLQQDQEGRIFYQGVNPRDAVTEQLMADYYPDQFHVVGSELGWTINQVCDAQDCRSVAVR